MTRNAQNGSGLVGGGRFARAALAFIGFLLLSSCASARVLPSPSSPAPTVLPVPSVAPGPSATSSPTLGSGNSEAVTLTIWAPEEFAPEAGRGGQVMQRLIADFQSTHPDTRVDFVLKGAHGKGGLLDFMLKVQALVPSRLPDLVIIDSRELDSAARAGLLQPLDRDLPSGFYADLLPPAQQLARYQGRWLSLPVTLEVQHLAYNSKTVRTPPANWDQLLSGGAAFAFPADDDDAFVFQYLQNRGRLVVSNVPIPLDLSVTTSVLTFFQRARAANLVPESVLTLKTLRETWQAFKEGQAALAQVEASDFMGERSEAPNSGFASLPTRDGQAATLVSGWNYAIVTSEPRRHAAAAEFLNWMNDPSRLAEWAMAAGQVPARRSAFALAIDPPEYADFLLSLLDTAIVAPTFAQRAPYASAWNAALQSVLRGQATASEAAQKAVQTLAP